MKIALIGETSGEQLPELAGKAAASVTRFYLEPENQAYLFGCMAGAVISAHTRMRAIPSFMFILGCGLMVRGAWSLADGMRSDLREIAETVKPR